ncbi:hypothetical protein, variant 1 [Phytophthora nicotianae CJ01A1]|uniref:Uncharacterized protein n=5 Tax=Phytophthora nicotianae TaxID=4792 RepID=W2PCN5_PHYN3|nr:hypothetical protein, variant 1 [Phytophthora nicotianae INRA-310]ETI43983.1 hypothetical protein, variant 1 [Phytophthora nicotianae P1569]ETK94286.1 hypothetical protein, variant 1 [Phytophthora nicotianae]ETO72667.1 hypothetical protein, variant 1 [Phytophthora nicotianae P1976]ETP13793.1 hypothetical protein, variant 1 [Phytophthora nicotianae CJ01A1]ETL37443.1 hypothetical protein, variant 1 [Phytophthora nicotianae]
MGWKAVESEEYESSAPAVQAHFHAVRAEEALRRDDVRVSLYLLCNSHKVSKQNNVQYPRFCVQYIQAEKEGHLASEKFLQAAQRVSDKRTIDALMLLAENYEYRAKVARARNPGPAETEEKLTVTEERHDADIRERNTVQQKVETEIPDPEEAQKTETQLNVAAAEMEELWRRLNEIGLSSPGSADKNLLMSSRHLSSSLGDSFCLLPAKTRTTIGVVATAVDGGSTLRAAVASRMRNQRQRLMEQQLGGRAPLDPRRSGATPTNGNDSSPYQYQDGRSSAGNDNGSVSGQGDYEGLQETVAHQKMEIVRLLNAVKTLSSENTKLVKKCEALTNIQAENREIRESMDLFKKDYNQKLVMIKRALEEWRRQRNSGVQASPQPSSAMGGNSALENKLKMQEEQIAKLMEEAKIKDDRIAKYDKWYKTLKAGAKAKQLSQSRDGRNVASSFSSSSFVQNGGGSSHSFTNSTSFHDYSPGSEESTGARSSTSRQFSRPPAHPNRRAL